MPESKPAAFIVKHLLSILAVASLSAVAAGVSMVFGAGWACIAAGGLLWIDLTLAGLRKGTKP